MNLSGSEVQIFVLIRRRVAIEGLEPAGEVVSRHEVREMRAELIVVVVVIALHCRVFDRTVHPLVVTSRPRMIGFGQAVIDSARFADQIEAHWPRINLVFVPRLFGKLDAIICEDCVDPVGNHIKQEF